MDKEIFMQNVEKYCAMLGTKPTIACIESGAGKNLINHIKTRGSTPSVEKVQLLATYLGVTTSELLGEVEPALDEKRLAPTKESEPLDDEIIRLWTSLPAADAEKVKAFVQGLIAAREEPPSDAE